MEALWATILFSGFALEVIIRQKNKKKKKADPIMDAYRDLMPNAKSIADLLKHEAQLREKLQDAVGALLLQAKIQGFSKWQSDYISGNDLRL